MKAAIYARYSSENQSEKSIDDQIRVCKRYITEHGMSIEDRHIFVDEAVSGSLVSRPGLQSLEQAAQEKQFTVVVVDDLSRLSRSNHQMLTMVLKFGYTQVKLISVSDGIVTDDENSKLGIHLRGLMNEMYLDDLRKKTMRGQEGQKLRGFSVGEHAYGFDSKPVGELRLNRKGQAKYDGMVHHINPEEAEVIVRIYKDFANGRSIRDIVARLNEDKIPTKRNYKGGWNRSSVTRILKNEKYIGIWEWRKSKRVRDPLTGRCKQVPRVDSEKLVSMHEDRKIVSNDMWNQVQQRWKDLEGAYPVNKNNKKIVKQKSCAQTHPEHLFSGVMRCALCEGPIVMLSGARGGYYGCYNYSRKTCKNSVLVARKKIEKTIIFELKEKILTMTNVAYVYKKVEKVASEKLNDAPDSIKKKKAQLDKIEYEIRNYMGFIRAGNLSRTVGDALKDAETRSDEIKEDIGSLEYQLDNQFQAPPKEWIQSRLEKFYEILGKDTTRSALVLKEVVGTIRLEPVMDKEADPFYGLSASLGDCFGPASPALAMTEERDSAGPENPEDILQRCPEDFLARAGNDAGPKRPFKPYYVAHTRIQTLALMDERIGVSNWAQWRGRREFIPPLPQLLMLEGDTTRFIFRV